MKTTVVAVCLLVTVVSAHAAKQSPKFNIVFILADDMGIWASHTYGNPEIQTPNIDKLADEGVKFNNAFCNTPVCSASRTSYFTGTFSSGVSINFKGRVHSSNAIIRFKCGKIHFCIG